MKYLFFLLLFFAAFSPSQIIKDSILGKPKFVKESVIFLNNAGPYTFMNGDNEYGHATKMTPNNLRKSMRDTWFETYFCRYINNETYYDRNRNIVKETWYYKSGEIVDDYTYAYDHLNRLVIKKSKNKYSETSHNYFYEKDSKTPKFGEYYYNRENTAEKYGGNFELSKPLFVSKFDILTRTDSLFVITNDIWKKMNDSAYIRDQDSIFHKKLSNVKIYNNQYKVIEEKFFDYKSDYPNKKTSLGAHLKYEYDELGNLIKQTSFKNGKISSFIIFENGKKVKKEDIDGGRIISTVYTYTKDQKLQRETIYYNDNIWNDIRFEFRGNYITKLFYLDKTGKGNKEIVPTVVNFKYKFDKQKNWTEVVKNVDGKDLYKWIRKIEYY
ncbi:hypothetical protein [Chryseobacterium viscerum]|uniref:Uncharacterized protein n=1 Tax=Chryseobacterium viscerum TaxID=1037377 RepID=A0A316WH38_9FLAO|nr:hypothetical protein [Chryseobacterium viscerum]PWN60479.1 hypothetical protein C1634_016180 [Chryseobacterium viscerum]